MLPQLRSRPFYLVQLLPSEKMVTGSGGLTFEMWQGRRERFRRETAAEGLWLDTTRVILVEMLLDLSCPICMLPW